MTLSEPRRPLDELLEHQDFLRRLAGSLVRDPAGADDLVQETWRVALEKRPRGLASPRGWLARVMRNLASERRRGQRRREAREHDWRPEARVRRPDELHENQLLRARLAAAFEGLKEDERELVELRFAEGLAPREIAARTGLPVTQVYDRLRRGVARVRADLDREYGGRDAWCVALLALCGLEPRRAAASTATFAPWLVLLVATGALLGAWRLWPADEVRAGADGRADAALAQVEREARAPDGAGRDGARADLAELTRADARDDAVSHRRDRGRGVVGGAARARRRGRAVPRARRRVRSGRPHGARAHAARRHGPLRGPRARQVARERRRRPRAALRGARGRDGGGRAPAPARSGDDGPGHGRPRAAGRGRARRGELAGTRRRVARAGRDLTPAARSRRRRSTRAPGCARWTPPATPARRSLARPARPCHARAAVAGSDAAARRARRGRRAARWRARAARIAAPGTWTDDAGLLRAPRRRRRAGARATPRASCSSAARPERASWSRARAARRSRASSRPTSTRSRSCWLPPPR
ncbi:MAG: sigma-70 family RNA polymerase sigma factor [Planctomycetes bacterium]|nr:sigma-70 family RNA polymerase sigma factor [Planctomycetota bacterium]